MRTADEFWSKVVKTPTCWLWTGARSSNRKGEPTYGNVIWEGRLQKAHRVAWELVNGPLPGDTSVGARGTLLLHSCDNPPCVRPDHLRTGTQHDNIGEAAAKRRMRNGRVRGYQTKATKLRPADVEAIRGRVAGGETQAALARAYSVTPALASLIVRHRVW